MDIKEFIEKVESSDLLYLAWKESNLTPSQMEDAWGVIKSVMLDAAFVAELPGSNDITPLTDVLDRPEHVALQYQEPTGSLVKKPNLYVCSICGKDTSEVEYDYMIGYDHLSCSLEALKDQKLPLSNQNPEIKEPVEPVQTKTKKVKTEKIGENSNKGDKTFLELLARGEYKSPKE